jgi:hypothetical protein
MQHVMSEARTKISGRLFNAHLNNLRLRSRSMDAVVVEFPLFGDSHLIGDFERVSSNSLDRWAAWASLRWLLIPVSAADLL